MPIYGYRCKGCGEKFDALRGIHEKDNEVECPKCGKKNPQRVLSSVYSYSSSGDKGNLRIPT